VLTLSEGLRPFFHVPIKVLHCKPACSLCGLEWDGSAGWLKASGASNESSQGLRGFGMPLIREPSLLCGFVALDLKLRLY
jgi:hypothetical protein